jgi:hypothetical protein
MTIVFNFDQISEAYGSILAVVASTHRTNVAGEGVWEERPFNA